MKWIKCTYEMPKEYEIVLLIASKKEDFNFTGDRIHHQNQQFVGYLGDRNDWNCVYGDGWYASVRYSYPESPTYSKPEISDE